MSYPMSLPRGSGGRPVLSRRLGIRLAVGIALVLARLRPVRLRAVLARIAAGAAPARYGSTLAVHREVLAVSPRCAGWRGCLPRSISIALLCRASGTWPDWCAGARAKPPYAAHAWVEAEGKVVGEPGTAGDHRALLRVPAGTAGRADQPGAGPVA
ncbi:hypothetical protein GCM10027570_45830 [Streptomonospora sediminis]